MPSVAACFGFIDLGQLYVLLADYVALASGLEFNLREEPALGHITIPATYTALCAQPHNAVFPMDLVRPCILAGCPKGGVALDPFAGSGTVGDVATELGRDAVLIELNPVYVQMQKGRGAIGDVLAKHEPDATDKPEDNPGWLF